MQLNCFYFGQVLHERFVEPRHRFTYRIAYAFIDVDTLQRRERVARLFGLDRTAPLSMLARDHGEGDNDLGAWVKRLLKRHGAEHPAARIMLLALPRMLGFCFNPVSFYFIYGADDKLLSIVCEVNNTFGGRHFYFLDVEKDAAGHCRKAFFVSPFLDSGGRYEFRFSPPDDAMSVDVLYRNEDGRPAFRARMSGTRRPITFRQCLRVLFGLPFMTIGVVFAIHFEAARLWLKGAPFRAPNKA